MTAAVWGGGGTPAPRSPLPLPPPRWHLRGSSRCRGRGVRRKGSRFLIPLKSLLLFVFVNQCMLIRTSLPPPSLILPPFSRPVLAVPTNRLHLYSLFGYPLHHRQFGDSSAKKSPPPFPEGQRNKNPHKMACETSSWKGFFCRKSGGQAKGSLWELGGFPICRAA